MNRVGMGGACKYEKKIQISFSPKYNFICPVALNYNLPTVRLERHP